MTRVLALDQGTSATKAVVFCTESGLLAEVDEPVTGLTFDGDAVEQDVRRLTESLVAAGRRALDAAGVGVDAVGVGNQGETVVAVDRAGAPLGPALSWQDRRAGTVTEQLAPHADELTALTGVPPDPYFAAAKMAWLARTAGQADRYLMVDAYLLRELTGTYGTDPASASRTGMLDLDALTWSDRAIELYGLGRDQPAIQPCDATRGTTSVFGGTLPVTGAVVDQQAALFAQACRAAGEAKCTYGTGAFLLANQGAVSTRSATGFPTTVAWSFADGEHAYCLDGQAYTVGAALSWLRRLGLLDDPRELDAVAADTTDVVFVPTLAGEGAPNWRPNRRGAFLGLGLSSGRPELLRGVIDGIAAQVTHIVRAMLPDGVRTLRVDGGLTRSALLMQTQADMLGVPVEVYPYDCATALGVAAIALRGLDGPGAEDAVLAGWSPRRTYEPRADRQDVYERWVDALGRLP